MLTANITTYPVAGMNKLLGGLITHGFGHVTQHEIIGIYPNFNLAQLAVLKTNVDATSQQKQGRRAETQEKEHLQDHAFEVIVFKDFKKLPKNCQPKLPKVWMTMCSFY